MPHPVRARAAVVALAVLAALLAAGAALLLCGDRDGAPATKIPECNLRLDAVGADPGPRPPVEAATPANRPAAATATQPEPLLEQYWGSYLAGNKTGWLRVLATRAIRDGKPVIELHEEHYGRSHSKIAEKTRESRTEVLGWLDEDLSVLEFTITSTELDRVSVTRAVRDARGYEVTTDHDGQRRVKRLDDPGPVCGSWDLLLMRLAREGKLRPGETTTFREFELGVPRAVEKTIRTRAVLDPSPGSRKAYEVEFDNIDLTLDARGVVAVGRMGGTELRALDEAEARRFDEDAVVVVRDDFNIDFNFPRWGALDEVVLSVVVHDDDRGDIFAANEYQRVESRCESGTGFYTVTMRPYRIREAAERARTEPPCDLAEFLEPNPMEQCDDPAIVAKAREIVGPITDPLEQVRAVSNWVNVNLTKRYTEIAGLSASETLREMGGDCSEHAVLFNALTRALAIPVRQCSGFVFLGEIGGRHAWSQVFVDGRWIHVDTVLDSVGADPRYILFYQHKPGHERDLTYDRRMTHLTTHPARATVESFSVFGKSWTPLDAASSAKVENGRYENPILGVSFDLPAGWKSSPRRFSLTQAQFRSGAASFGLRVQPHRFAALQNYPWMFGLMGNEATWKPAPVGNRQGWHAETRQGDQRQSCWVIEFEDGLLMLQHAGPPEAGAAVEKAVQSLVLLEPGGK